MSCLSSYHILFLCTCSATKDIKPHSSSCALEQMFCSELDWSLLMSTPYVLTIAMLIILQIEEWAEEWGHGAELLGREERGGLLEEGGESCDVLINKRQLCMMLTAGWSGPRHNPPRLLLTFQRPGAYPRRRAQSSLSRSSSVQGSGGGRPWLSLSYQPSEKHTHIYTHHTQRARTPCRYCMCRHSEIPPGKMPLTLYNTSKSCGKTL